MIQQNYNNHLRYYIPHHFVFYPVLIVLFGISIYKCCCSGEWKIWLFFAILISLIGWLSFMLRQHYSLGNQNRIVRLEMRLRYYELTGQSFTPLEQKLQFSQIAALRFSGDDELVDLIRKTIAENLTSNQVKKLIKNWVPDEMRV